MSRLPRVVLIVNPYATAVTPGRTAAVAATLERRCEVIVRPTRGPGHAREIAAAAADDADALVVFSGDGTYNEAINGAGAQIPFGFIPGGGTSVFPRALGLPRDPVRAAAQVLDALEAGRTSRISLGRINGRRFCFAAGIGLDAEIVRRVDRRGRDREGHRAASSVFIATLARRLLENRFRIAPQLAIEGFGRAALLIAVNGQPYSYAGALPLRLTDAARFSEGLDFVAPREVSPWLVPPLALGLFRGSLGRSPHVLAAHDLDVLEVRCDRPLAAQADGEDLGDVVEVRFEAERNALSVLR